MEIRKTYKSHKGKVPDWIIKDGAIGILIECKATGFSRKALATGDQTAIQYVIDHVIEGLVQLHEFRNACDNQALGLEKVQGCSTFKLVIVTFESLYIINSGPFKDILSKKLADELSAKGISTSPWTVLSIEELERFQMHLTAGLELKTVLDDLESKSFNEVYEDIRSKSDRTYRDSFLYEKDIEIYKRLNVNATYDS